MSSPLTALKPASLPPPASASTNAAVEEAASVQATRAEAKAGEGASFAQSLDEAKNRPSQHSPASENASQDATQASAASAAAATPAKPSEQAPQPDNADAAKAALPAAETAAAAALAAAMIAAAAASATPNIAPLQSAATVLQTSAANGTPAKTTPAGPLGLSAEAKAPQGAQTTANLIDAALPAEGGVEAKALGAGELRLASAGGKAAGASSQGAAIEANPLALSSSERPSASLTQSFDAALSSTEGQQAQGQAALHAAKQGEAAARSEAARTEAPQFTLRTPISQQGWSEEVGQRVSWMAGKDLGRAELVLTPPHLGRIEVSLTVSGDQASASFAVSHPGAYAALEQALPRLREVMNQAGIDLNQVNVSSSGAGENGNASQSWRQGQGRAGGSAEHGLDTAPAVLRSGNGLVDTFA